MQTINITKREYNSLKEKAKLSDSLLLDLVKGLEDIKNGRIKPFKK